MTILTTYECDHCLRVSQSNEQMWDVEVRCVSNDRRSYSRFEPAPVFKVLWCRECVDKYGALGKNYVPKEKPSAVAPITIEDLIREIVTDAMTDELNQRS